MTPQARVAFEQAALPHLDALYGAALRLTRNPSDAEDLVQDALVRAYRFWHTFQEGTSIRAWLFTIVRNTFINGYHQRNRQRNGRADLSAQLNSLGDRASVGSVSGANVPEPDASLSRKITQAHLLTALETLPEDYRTAVVLADMHGFLYREIAEVMGCPIGTVMSRLYRGRKLLAGLLADVAAREGWTTEPDTMNNAPVDLANYRKRGQA